MTADDADLEHGYKTVRASAEDPGTPDLCFLTEDNPPSSGSEDSGVASKENKRRSLSSRN